MIRVMHIVPGLGSSGAERGATDLARTLNRERFEVGANSLRETRSARTWARSSRETGVPRGASGQAPGFLPEDVREGRPRPGPFPAPRDAHTH